MKIGRQSERASSISSSNAETIVVRGRDLCAELIGRTSFTDFFWLLLTGSAPQPAQSRMLDATLVAISEHGLVPSVQASRVTYAAAPEALQGAVAAGILGCGSVILGAAVANALGCGFVPIRKPGKLPAATLRETYALEYGSDSLEVHKDAVGHGHRVLVIDDVLATGGTARAAANLVRQLGGNLRALAFLIELDALNGRAKLNGEEVYSLLKY